MRINKHSYNRMVNGIYDDLLGKKGNYKIYISKAMYKYIVLNTSCVRVSYSKPTLLGYELEVDENLNGEEFRYVKYREI